MPQRGEFGTERLSQLHTSETSGVNVGKAKGKTERDCCSNDGTDKGGYNREKGVHLLLYWLGGTTLGILLVVPIIWVLCKYVWFA
jgi:hypothetical protein